MVRDQVVDGLGGRPRAVTDVEDPQLVVADVPADANDALSWRRGRAQGTQEKHEKWVRAGLLQGVAGA